MIAELFFFSDRRDHMETRLQNVWVQLWERECCPCRVPLPGWYSYAHVWGTGQAVCKPCVGVRVALSLSVSVRSHRAQRIYLWPWLLIVVKFYSWYRASPLFLYCWIEQTVINVVKYYPMLRKTAEGNDCGQDPCGRKETLFPKSLFWVTSCVPGFNRVRAMMGLFKKVKEKLQTHFR